MRFKTVLARKPLQTAALSAAIFLFSSIASAQQGQTLYYYGVVTNVNDPNMLNITQDLFAAQLRGMDFASFDDRRADAIKKSYTTLADDTTGNDFFSLVQGTNTLDEGGVVFYARIYRPQADEKWECSFFSKNIATAASASLSRKYDSYYKILTDAKFLIQTVLSDVTGSYIEGQEAAAAPPPQRGDYTDTGVAGTWSGESDISKIILMRSGRGFIVFTNGATMNISISVSNTGGGRRTLRIVQQDKFNASFYPDIDRKIVLAYAEQERTAPIEWNMTLTDNSTLVGTKKTLASNGGVLEPSSVSVKWTKR